MNRLPNAERAVVDVEKLRSYCLNLGHPRGQHKAVSIPRHRRGLYVVSRSKRLCGDANAAPLLPVTFGWPTQSPSFN